MRQRAFGASSEVKDPVKLQKCLQEQHPQQSAQRQPIRLPALLLHLHLHRQQSAQNRSKRWPTSM